MYRPDLNAQAGGSQKGGGQNTQGLLQAFLGAAAGGGKGFQNGYGNTDRKRGFQPNLATKTQYYELIPLPAIPHERAVMILPGLYKKFLSEHIMLNEDTEELVFRNVPAIFPLSCGLEAIQVGNAAMLDQNFALRIKGLAASIPPGLRNRLTLHKEIDTGGIQHASEQLQRYQGMTTNVTVTNGNTNELQAQVESLQTKINQLKGSGQKRTKHKRWTSAKRLE